MKKVISMVLSVVIAFSTFSFISGSIFTFAEAADPLQDHLIAQYNFEDANNLGEDSSGKGNNATPFGNVSSVDGVRGTAVNFNSENHTNSEAYMEIPATLMNHDQVTLMTWVKFDLATVGGWSRIVEFDCNWGGHSLFYVAANSKNGWDGYTANYQNSAVNQMLISDTLRTDTPRNMPPVGVASAQDGCWHNVAIVLDGTTMKIYINGEFAKQVDGIQKPSNLDDLTKAYIGKTGLFGDGTYNGEMDDFRLYDVALTGEEISNVNSFTSDDFVVANYTFDDASNLTADSSRNDNDATVGTGTLATAEGKNGSAVKLDGNTYMKMPNGILLGSQGATIMTWVKYDQLPKDYEYLFMFGYPEGDAYMGLAASGLGSGIGSTMSINYPDNGTRIGSSVKVTQNEWANIAFTINDSIVKIYLNGIQIAENKALDMDASDLSWTTANFIGRGVFNDPFAECTIDDFKIFSKALSQSQILSESGISMSGLSNITVDGQDILGFKNTVGDYQYVLPTGTSIVPTIAATAFRDDTSVTVTQATSLSGKATIETVAADGTEVSYSVNFVVPSVEVNSLKQPELANVQIDDPFWSPKLELFQDVTVRDYLEKCDAMGLFNNFDKVAAGNRNTQDFIGGNPFWDGLIYGAISAAGSFMVNNPDPELKAITDGYIDRICAAADTEPDGYLSCFNELMTDGLRFDETDALWNHDVYNFGVLCDAAVNYYLGTGDTKLLYAATRFSNYMADTFGYGKINMVTAHEGPETQLLELYELYSDHPEIKNLPELSTLNIDETKYKDLAQFWVENRGNHDNPTRINNANYTEYAQDQDYYYEQNIAAGHAVRANLFYDSIISIGRLTKDNAFLTSAYTLWEDIVNKQMYITGGTGSTSDTERYGGDYYLPNDSYCETCAQGSMACFSEDMALAFADSKYADNVELEMYNGILGGVGEDGNSYFYQNPLTSNMDTRWDWHGCPCCPQLFLRYMSNELPRSIYAYSDNNIYVNQYVGSTVQIDLNNVLVSMKQESNYVSDGTSKITINPSETSNFTLRLRMPSWSENTVVKVNGQEVNPTIINGYAVLTQTWSTGDTVEIAADMTPRREYANPNVEEDQGKVTLARGPLVYCVEGVDNMDGDTGDVSTYLQLSNTSELTTKYMDIYGGVYAIQSNATYTDQDNSNHDIILTAIPFYSRANRGATTMNVWIAEDETAVTNWPKIVAGGNKYVDFEKEEDLERFDIFSTSSTDKFEISNCAFVARHGAEMKAVLKETENIKDCDISVDIKPNSSGIIMNGGIYLLSNGAANTQDRISAYNVNIESAEGSNAIIVNVFKFNKDSGYLGSIQSVNISNYFDDGNQKGTIKLRAVVNEGIMDVYIGNSNTPCLRNISVSDLGVGSVGLRSQFSDISFDNFLVISPEINGEEKPTIVPEEPSNPDDSSSEENKDEVTTYNFDNQAQATDFNFYSSSNGSFAINNGLLTPSGESGEFKAIINGNCTYESLQVDIIPGASGTINSGFYIAASGAGNAVDAINALGIFVQSDFEGWEDAANRVDLIIGSFPNWTEKYRVISETGANNALFTNGVKEPLCLKVDIDGDKVTVTLSLISDPSKYITKTFEYAGASVGSVGLRSFFNDAGFDNLSVTYVTNEVADGNSTDSPSTGETYPIAIPVAIALASTAFVICKKKKKATKE